MFGYREVAKCKCGKIYKFNQVLKRLPKICTKCGRKLLVNYSKEASPSAINDNGYWYDKDGSSVSGYYASNNIKLIGAKHTLFGWKESEKYGSTSDIK